MVKNFDPMFDPASLYKTVPLAPLGTTVKNSLKADDAKIHAKIQQWLNDQFPPKQSSYLYKVWRTLEPAPILKKKARGRGKLNSLIISKKLQGNLYSKLPLVTKNGYALYFLKPAIYEGKKGNLKITFYPEAIKADQLFEQKWLEIHRKSATANDGDLLLKSGGGLVLHTSKQTDFPQKKRSSLHSPIVRQRQIFPPKHATAKPPIPAPQDMKKNISGLFDEDVGANLQPTVKLSTNEKGLSSNPLIGKILEIARRILSFFTELWKKLFSVNEKAHEPPSSLLQSSEQDSTIDSSTESSTDEEMFIEKDPEVTLDELTVVISDQPSEKDTQQEDDKDDILDFFN